MGIVFLILFLVIALICAFKESKITVKYKTFGVYGRFSAYLFLDLLLVGILLLVGGIVPSLRVIQDVGTLAGIGIGACCIAIAVLIFLRARRKCPAGPLQQKLLLNMLISGMGVCLKVAFFFLVFVWKTVLPEERVDEYGRTIYIFSDGDVMDSNGQYVGKMTDTNTYRRNR